MNSKDYRSGKAKVVAILALIPVICIMVLALSFYDLMNMWQEQVDVLNKLTIGMTRTQVHAEVDRMGNITYKEPPVKYCNKADAVRDTGKGMAEYWIVRSRLQPWFLVTIGFCYDDADKLIMKGSPDS